MRGDARRLALEPKREGEFRDEKGGRPVIEPAHPGLVPLRADIGESRWNA